MNTNATPHLLNNYQNMNHNNMVDNIPAGMDLFTSGGLKDGWSYLLPKDNFLRKTDEKVTILHKNELHGSVKEQVESLCNLYSLSSSSPLNLQKGISNFSLMKSRSREEEDQILFFLIKRGMQVVGYIQYDDKTGILIDVVLRPSANREVGSKEEKGVTIHKHEGITSTIGEVLIKAVLAHAKKSGKEKVLIVPPQYTGMKQDTSATLVQYLERFGFMVYTTLNKEENSLLDKPLKKESSMVPLVYQSRL